MADPDPIFQRLQAAWKRREQWTSLLDEAFRYALPDHDAYQTAQPGQSNYTQVYDATAIEALVTRVARDHGALFPSGERWMGAELPAVPPEEEENAEAYLADAIDKFHAAIEASNFHMEIPTALREAHVSTGVLQLEMGTAANPLRFEALSIAQIAPEPALGGVLRSGYRKYAIRGREVRERFPDADLPPDLAKRIADAPEAEVALCDAVAWVEPEQQWQYRVYALKQGGSVDREALLHEAEFTKASPRICFRVDKGRPQDWMGRGAVLAQLPNIKSVNKVVELILKNASIAVTGIWQADDDGVLNPGTVRLVPGAIIPKAVGSSGLTPLQTPGRFDVSELVLGDLRGQIARAIAGPELPAADQGDRRSAYEYSVRLAQRAEVEVPRILRLTHELMQPLGAQVFAILTHPAMRNSQFYIAPFRVNGEELLPSPQPPLSRLREQQEAGKAVQTLAVMMQLNPAAADQAMHWERFIDWQLSIGGMPESVLKTRAEKVQAQEEAQQQQALQLAAMAAEGQGEQG